MSSHGGEHETDTLCALLYPRSQGLVGDALERALYIVRKQVDKAKAGRLPADKAFDFYTCSLSSRTIVYKAGPLGACTVPVLARRVCLHLSCVRAPGSETGTALLRCQTRTAVWEDKKGFMCVLCCQAYSVALTCSMTMWLLQFFKLAMNPICVRERGPRV